MKKVKLFAMVALSLGVFLTSCDAEDGINGLNGTDGIDGQDGADGADVAHHL